MTDKSELRAKARTLTETRLRTLLHYNPETGVFTWLRSCRNHVVLGDIAGCIHASGYRRILIDRITYTAHRLAWLYMTGEWPRADIDHINLDRADNRWVNLREATRSQNCANTPR